MDQNYNIGFKFQICKVFSYQKKKGERRGAKSTGHTSRSVVTRLHDCMTARPQDLYGPPPDAQNLSISIELRKLRYVKYVL